MVISPKYADWRLVAQADWIVKARLSVPASVIRTAVSSKKHVFANLEANIIEVLKGKPTLRFIKVRYYTEPQPDKPAPQTVLNLDGNKVLAFLLQNDNEYTAGLYFAGNTPSALQPFKSATANMVQAEVNQQRQLVGTFKHSPAAKLDRLDGKVRMLIAQMLSASTAVGAFRDLERLGNDAVPATIRQMDDRRRLPALLLELENKFPHAFESHRYHAPKQVVDALAAILNQITGEDFGFINNGATERERARTVSGWRVYLRYGSPKPLQQGRIS